MGHRLSLHHLRSMALLLVILTGLTLRLLPWDQNRFLEDEALYAYWGLQIATGSDPMLDTEPVDKPPLFPYILAASFRLLAWPSLAEGTAGARVLESAARLPSLLASTASIALVYALARSLPPPLRSTRAGREWTPHPNTRAATEISALLAALLVALSPFDILFASTAFTDPLLTAWVLAALFAAVRGHLGAAGLLAGLAAATKQQGLLFLPLVVMVGAMAPISRPRPIRSWLRFGVAFAAVAAAVIAWDLARVQRPGFWEQGLLSYGGLGLVRLETLGRQAIEWLRLAGSLWASPWYTGLMLLALGGWFAGSRLLDAIPRPNRLDWALLVFVVSYLLFHWLMGFQVWDRYLLGLVPLVALLAARAFVAIGQALPRPGARQVYAGLLGPLIVLSLAGPVRLAARSELPLGGDHGAYDGIDQLASYMRSEVPPGSVLYHYWLGYHHRFYLYGTPLRLHWYPDLADLTHDATVYRREPRYIAIPSWRDGAPIEGALAEAGIILEPAFATLRRDGSTSFRLYRLEGP